MDNNKVHIDVKVSKVASVEYAPIFKALTKKQICQSRRIEFNSGECLRKLRQVQQSLQSIVAKTLIYDEHKLALVNIINERNSIILHGLAENIEAIQLLCGSDRNYRRRIIREKARRAAEMKSQSMVNESATMKTVSSNNSVTNTVICDIMQNDVSILDLFNNLIDVSKCKPADTGESMSNSELDNLLSNTADKLGTNVTPKTCEPLKLIQERTSIFSKNGITLYRSNDEVGSEFEQDIMREKAQNKAFSEIILSTPNDYTGAEMLIPGYVTETEGSQIVTYGANNVL